MRRTARVLASAALAGAAFCAAAPAAFAEPGAEVSPGTVAPGGTVTVTVTCASVGGAPPATLDATSAAFDEGTVRLRRAPGKDDPGGNAVYRGTARVGPAADFAATGPSAVTQDSAWTVDGTCPGASGRAGRAWSATFSVDRGDARCPDPGGSPCAAGPDHHGGKPCPDPRADTCPGKPDHDGGKPDHDGGKPDHDGGRLEHDGGRPEHDGGKPGYDGGWPDHDGGKPEHHGGKPDHDAGRPCPEPGRGGCEAGAVQAGEGGTFTDSVPALVAGGVLITGAFGAAAHRLIRRDPTGGR